MGKKLAKAIVGISTVTAAVHLANNFVFLIVILPFLHGIAYLICLKEPLALEILIMKSSNFMQCSNKTFYNGTNSYDLY